MYIKLSVRWGKSDFYHCRLYHQQASRSGSWDAWWGYVLFWPRHGHDIPGRAQRVLR